MVLVHYPINSATIRDLFSHISPCASASLYFYVDMKRLAFIIIGVLAKGSFADEDTSNSGVRPFTLQRSHRIHGKDTKPGFLPRRRKGEEKASASTRTRGPPPEILEKFDKDGGVHNTTRTCVA